MRALCRKIQWNRIRKLNFSRTNIYSFSYFGHRTLKHSHIKWDKIEMTKSKKFTTMFVFDARSSLFINMIKVIHSTHYCTLPSQFSSDELFRHFFSIIFILQCVWTRAQRIEILLYIFVYMNDKAKFCRYFCVIDNRRRPLLNYKKAYFNVKKMLSLSVPMNVFLFAEWNNLSQPNFNEFIFLASSSFIWLHIYWLLGRFFFSGSFCNR